MIPQQRPPSASGLTRSLTYLLLLASLTIHTIRCQADEVSSASGFTCTPECGPGYECILGLCKRKQCTKDCTGVEKKLLCGSDGTTYDNMCELEKAECELARDIFKEYNGICITLPPPPAQLCKTQQKDFDFGPLDKYYEKCHLMTAMKKNENGTLEQSDVDNCYRPQCYNNGNYVPKQCSYHFREWCWCSSPDGYAIPGTFQRNMPDDYCSNRPTCDVEGENKTDGEVYTPKGFCGLCECINGTHTCFVNHTVDANGRLSNDSLENLRKQLIQVFNFQYNHNDHIKVDIRHIYKYPTEVSNAQKETILGWKFNYYDRNDDDILHRVEEFIFHDELAEFFGCNSFFKHLNELTDKNGDNEISLQEWNDLFKFNTSDQPNQVVVVKREALSAVPRKPLHLRKKFHYVLH